MNIDVLSLEERVATGFTHKITIPYSDIAVETSAAAFSVLAALSDDETVARGTRVKSAAARVTEAFVFSPGTLAFTLGDGGDVDRYIASSDLETAAYLNGVQANVPYVYNAADTIDLVVTASAGALSSITAGELVILLELNDLQKLF